MEKICLSRSIEAKVFPLPLDPDTAKKGGEKIKYVKTLQKMRINIKLCFSAQNVEKF